MHVCQESKEWCCVWVWCVQLVTPSYEDQITPLKAITEQPFWIPSQSLQLRMITNAHTLIQVLNQVGARTPCISFCGILHTGCPYYYIT